MTTKVVKGSLWTLAGQVAPLAISLVTTPFTIRMLGAEGYGVFILIGLIPTYLGFADFGMGMASTKFGSEAYAEGDEEKEGRVVRTAAVISLCTSVPTAALLLICAGYIINLFNVPAEFTSRAALALRLASVTFVINFLCGIFNTPQLARLRMDLNTLINATSRILGLIATPIALYMGYGIVGAISVLLIASLLNLAGHLVVSRNLLPQLVGTTIDSLTVRPAIKFGGGLILASVAGVLLVNAEKGILSATVSTTALAYYSIAFVFASMLTMFSAAMVQSLMPAFSQLQAESNSEQLNSLYSRGIRINLIWLVPVLVLLALVSKPFFTIWAGVDFGRESVLPFYILAAGLAFNILAYFPHVAIMASGRSDIFAKLYWAELFLYVFLVWVLASNFGIIGAAAAWSIRVVCDAILLFTIAKRAAGVSYSQSRNYRFLFGILIMLTPFYFNLYFQGINWIVLVSAMLALVAYCVIVWSSALEKEEIAWLANRLRVYS
jgi:O-antigen/teichoic acid export membrane protein